MRPSAVVVCVFLQAAVVIGDGVYRCPAHCSCTIMKRQRDRARTTVASTSGEQSSAPGRKVGCQGSSAFWFTAVSQIPLDSLPHNTLHLYVICASFWCITRRIIILLNLLLWILFLGDLGENIVLKVLTAKDIIMIVEEIALSELFLFVHCHFVF